jgi:hypothetical protein
MHISEHSTQEYGKKSKKHRNYLSVEISCQKSGCNHREALCRNFQLVCITKSSQNYGTSYDQASLKDFKRVPLASLLEKLSFKSKMGEYKNCLSPCIW